MGSCLSTRIKFQTALHCDRGGMGKSSSKVSSAILPSAPQISSEILQSPNLKSFSLSELKGATNDFSEDNVLGYSEFGRSFKGWIDEHSLKAVKPETGIVIDVKMLYQKGCQSRQEWLAKINQLGKICHPNLAKLIGFCLEDEHQLLVYEFIPNGNLANHLFGFGVHFQPLSWNLYMKIALGAAKGLAFLHYEADMLYREFTASNVLLDSNYNAKLCDFGLAKDVPIGSENHSRFLGTAGYVAPEYISMGHVTAKSNVYSFGVVLLEMLSGRPVTSMNNPSEQQDLVERARSLARLVCAGKVSRVLNPAALGQYSTSSVLKLAELASQCLSNEPEFRPDMKDVVQVLEEIQDSRENEGYKGPTHDDKFKKWF